MPFRIIRNDITEVSADVIVNTANPHPVIGGGTDSAIYKAAGEVELLAERKKIGDIAPGQAVATPAFNLNARYIIHTVGPVWVDGNHGERETLRDCYDNSLSLAVELKAKSIAFPLISTGVYGFPRDEALDIATDAIGKFLLLHELDILLVVFDKDAVVISEELVGQIDKYIDEHFVEQAKGREYDDMSSPQRRRMNDIRMLRDMECSNAAPGAPYKQRRKKPFLAEDLEDIDLDDLLDNVGDSFQQKLFKLIDERGIRKDSEVYTRAFIDRRLFSDIRCKKNYRPKKVTVLSLGLALELNLAEMKDLLETAGYALSSSSRYDIIIQFCIEHGIYSILDVDDILEKYKQPTFNPR